jgi:hypothetical protein
MPKRLSRDHLDAQEAQAKARAEAAQRPLTPEHVHRMLDAAHAQLDARRQAMA